MAMHTGEQTVPSNEQVHGPGLTSDNAGAETPAARGPAAEPVVSEQASAQQQEDGTTVTAPRVRPSGPGLDLLFPNMEWKIPSTPYRLGGHPDSDSTGSGSGSSSARKQRIPYVLPVDSPSGVPGPDGHLGLSSALGVGDMPAILMYAPERPLLSGAADSMDGIIPEHLVLCVEEDAFERAWVAPQWYWRSVF